MKQKLKAVTGKYQRWRETADWTVGEEGGEGPKFPELFVQHIFKCTREAKATSPLPKILPSNQRGPYITHISAFFSRRYEKQSHLNPRKQIPAWVFLWSWDHNTAQVLLHNVFCLFFLLKLMDSFYQRHHIYDQKFHPNFVWISDIYNTNKRNHKFISLSNSWRRKDKTMETVAGMLKEIHDDILQKITISIFTEISYTVTN